MGPFVWGYALAWFLVNDRVKLLAYWVLDRAKVEVKPADKAETPPEAEPKIEAKHKAKAQAPSDMTPQIARRAYGLYERQGRHDGHAVQEWLQAEREIRKDGIPK